ncbi:MAG: mannose-1-phosphate guanylyltransferase/mannose-6-phosphate isomerase [Candidimonas sp.]|nr:MAG: mannose-1-phosphate guanylyltransferase/mannose-6-phosphate isomerase [Candidimonas sp.]
MRLIPVILCGGAGSRLWPVSREMHPKPFMRLADGKSLLQKAFLRGAALSGVQEILTVTNSGLFFKMADEFREIGLDGVTTSFILEPFGRNTAAAVAAAGLRALALYGNDTCLLILPADHLVTDQAAFNAAVAQAQTLAQSGSLVTFGIKPTAPETGFGYIEADGTQVLRFVEKPSVEIAHKYVQSGRFFWNSGMFCFTVAGLLAQMREHCPAILSAVQACVSQSKTSEKLGFTRLELDEESFKAVPEDSIDYALMEKSHSVAVVPCSIGWNDIGSWGAVSNLMPADGNGNRIQGKAVIQNATNCYIQSDGRVVGAVGVDDLMIVDTPDALLVAKKSACQDVKQVYAQLKAQGDETYKLHRTVHRPWGTYTILEDSDNFKIKRIEVKPGAQLSLQMHHHRSEHWIVVSGMAKVVNGDKEMLVNTNESTYIPAGHKHRLENPGILDLVLIEVQSGPYLGEDDIVRFDDVYGRA